MVVTDFICFIGAAVVFFVAFAIANKKRPKEE